MKEEGEKNMVAFSKELKEDEEEEEEKKKKLECSKIESETHKVNRICACDKN